MLVGHENEKQREDVEYSLSELVKAASEQLARRPRPADGRVAAVPDGRVVRYYQTLGIVSKPLRYDGRAAIYGDRHLLEIVTVKLLQSQGLSLPQIQRAMAGRSRKELERLHQGAASPGASEQEDRGGVPVVRDRLAGSETDQLGRFGRPLVSAQVAPGITVTIDPQRVEAPEEILGRLARILRGEQP